MPDKRKSSVVAVPARTLEELLKASKRLADRAAQAGRELNEIAEEMAKDKHAWVDFMMRYELGLEKPEANRARQSAITIGLSYIVGGIIPLSPYFFINDSQQALYYSCAITSICLFVFGYFKSKVTGQPPFAGALKVLIIGALAAAAAFGMAKVINGG